LDLDIPHDDSLRLAKKSADTEAPGVRLFIDSEGKPHWEGGYIWWACVNEEDGLDFRVAQETDGTRQLEVLWKYRRVSPSVISKLPPAKPPAKGDQVTTPGRGYQIVVAIRNFHNCQPPATGCRL
jgi:hypothetical protein